jgi:hypothetical protein
MNRYLLKETPSKARADVDRIMQEMDFKNIGFPRPSFQNKIIDFLVTLAGVAKAPFSLRRGDVLCLPYNIRKYYIFLCKVAHIRGAKVITLIHDLSSFYRKHVSGEDEIKRLSHSDYLIAHNGIMKRWLEDNGCKQPVGVLGIFDYLSTKEPANKPAPAELIDATPPIYLYKRLAVSRHNPIKCFMPERLARRRISSFMIWKIISGRSISVYTAAGSIWMR